MSGQIALVPGNMQMVPGGIKAQSKLVVRHIDRVLKAMEVGVNVRDVVQVRRIISICLAIFFNLIILGYMLCSAQFLYRTSQEALGIENQQRHRGVCGRHRLA